MGELATLSDDRDVALDATRGIALLLLLLSGDRSPVSQLRHARWDGFTVADLAAPLFLMCAGAALEISWSRALNRGVSSSVQLVRVLWRAIVLFAIGLFLLSASYASPRFNLGPLQCVAFGLLVGAIAVQLNYAARLGAAGLLYVTVVALAVVWVAMGGDWTLRWAEGSTRAEMLDRTMLGRFRAEVGLLGSLGSSVAVIWGTLLGMLIVELRSVRERGVRVLRLGTGMVVAGFCLSLLPDQNHWFYVPLNARLVTPSFSLVACGIGFLLYAALFFAAQHPRGEAGIRPLRILGSNTLAAFVGVSLLGIWVLHGWRVVHQGRAMELIDYLAMMAEGGVGPAGAALLEPCMKLAAGFGICLWLWRRRLTIKV